MNPRILAPLFMLSSTFSLSLTGLVSKFLAHEIPLQSLSFLRFLLPALILLGVMGLTHFRFPPKGMKRALWVRSVCIAGCQLCFIYSLQHLSLVESVVLFSTGPLFIPLLEKLIFGVVMKAGTVVSLAITFIGVLLLAGDVSGIHLRMELLVGLLAGALNAGSQLSLYRATKSDMRSIDINAWTFVCASILLLPLLFLPTADANVLQQTWGSLQQLAVVTALSGVSILVINTQIFRAKAYRLAHSGSQLAPLIFTNLLFTALWQQLFFNVQYLPTQMVGLGLIVMATFTGVLIPKLFKSSVSSNQLRSA